MSVLEAAIGWLAPPQCIHCGVEGASLCHSCATTVIVPFGDRCWRCASISPGSRTCASCYRPGSPSRVWITTTYDGVAQQLVQKYKFGQQRVASNTLSMLMTEAFLEANREINLNYYLVPVPTATSRVRQRGFDHAKLLAREIARQLKLKGHLNALGRLGQTSQVGSGRSTRISFHSNNYFVRNSKLIKDKDILIIDDVLTTGATLQAVSALLKSAGARRVDALIFAKRL